MQFPAVFSMVLAIASLGAFVQARPSPCPDVRRLPPPSNTPPVSTAISLRDSDFFHI